MRCILEENRQRDFEVPFYPAMWNFSDPYVNDQDDNEFAADFKIAISEEIMFRAGGDATASHSN